MLRDFLLGSDLLDLPLVGMFLFMALFAGVVVWVFRPGQRERGRRLAALPLEDEGRTAASAAGNEEDREEVRR